MTFTASSLSRALHCDGSIVLPRAENFSEWAEAGADEHEELADFASLPPAIAKHIPLRARSEVKLAFNVETGRGRVIGYGADRVYGELGPNEIAGSADVLGEADEDAIVICDFKTGYADVEPAATNPQLAFYALAAARALGKERAIVRVLYTKFNHCDEAQLDALDLADFAAQLRGLHQRAKRLRASGETPATREGAWCKHCASKHVCPSKTGLLVQIAEKGLAVIGDATMTTERAAGAYEQIVRVEQLIKDARKRLETYVDENGPINLGGGRMYGRYVRNGNERLDGATAVRAIAEVVGESVAIEFETIAVERKTSKAAIERAAKQLATTKGTAGKVIKRIRELGGTTNAPDSMPLGEYQIDRDQAAALPAFDADAANKALADVDLVPLLQASVAGGRT